MVRVAMVIPTIRKFEDWNSYKEDIEDSGFEVDVFTCGEEEDVNPHIDKVLFSSPSWRKSYYGEDNLWIFPAFTRHVNSIYGYILKENLKYDMIVTVDDDTSCNDGFFRQHWFALNQITFPNYENVFHDQTLFPRGFPINERNKGRKNVVFNQGLWNNIPDLNAIDYPSWNDGSIPLKLGYNIAQKHKAITVSSMNVAFRPICLSLYYQPTNFWRMDDIWAGLILKRILDVNNLYMGYGYPFVKHNKFPRNIWEDNKREANGMETNEKLWEELQKINLKGSIWQQYKQIADELPFPEITTFMQGWIKLIEE